MESQPAKTPNYSTGQVEADQANETVIQAHDERDPKKMRRMILNRESAERSHIRKQDYMHKLKKDIKEEEKIAVFTPEVCYHNLKCMLLEKEIIELQERLKALEHYQAYQEAEHRVLMAERDRLNFIYSVMQLHAAASSSGSSGAPPGHLNNFEKMK